MTMPFILSVMHILQPFFSHGCKCYLHTLSIVADHDHQHVASVQCLMELKPARQFYGRGTLKTATVEPTARTSCRPGRWIWKTRPTSSTYHEDRACPRLSWTCSERLWEGPETSSCSASPISSTRCRRSGTRT